MKNNLPDYLTHAKKFAHQENWIFFSPGDDIAHLLKGYSGNIEIIVGRYGVARNRDDDGVEFRPVKTGSFPLLSVEFTGSFNKSYPGITVAYWIDGSPINMEENHA